LEAFAGAGEAAPDEADAAGVAEVVLVAGVTAPPPSGAAVVAVAASPAAASPPPVAGTAGVALLEACTLSRWSFFAHPDPLNTMAGVDSALRIAPPHCVQTLGPSAVNECITSMGCPHTVHTYS